MNIYSTGMNPADCNALKRQPRVAIFQAYVEMMKYLQREDHDLTWRATKVGDPIPAGTELVIVSSMLPRSLNCPYALGAIWTMSEALRLDIPLIVYLCDWAFFRAKGEFKSIAKAGGSYFFKTIGGALQYNEDPTKVFDAGPQMLDFCAMYAADSSPLWDKAQIMVPRYTYWGDVKKVQELLPGANPVLTFDPTPIFMDYIESSVGLAPLKPMHSRDRRWILPSLLKDDTWILKQSLNWPVDRFGPKGFVVLDTERDIQNLYRSSIGAICHPYPHVGSGWWRSRWIHSAMAYSILLCDVRDGRQLDPAYMHSGRYIENRSMHELESLAQEQKDVMFSKLQTDKELLEYQMYSAFGEAGA